MVRGIEGRRIFLQDEDRWDFVTRLERLLPEESWRCFAWALMPNHVHLVLQSRTGDLSRLMARLNTGYARSFNQHHQRCGYLFQNRFKSRVVPDDADLAGVVTYVHRNPLKAEIVRSTAELERYAWCGHGALLGIRPTRRFEAIGACLSLFADDAALARHHVRVRMAAVPLDQEPGPDPAAPRPRPPGSPVRPEQRPILRRRSGTDAREELERLIRRVAKHFGVSEAEIRSPWGTHRAALARAIAVHLAIDELGMQGRSVAAALGLTPSAVSHARRRGRAAVQASSPTESLSRLCPSPSKD